MIKTMHGDKLISTKTDDIFAVLAFKSSLRVEPIFECHRIGMLSMFRYADLAYRYFSYNLLNALYEVGCSDEDRIMIIGELNRFVSESYYKEKP